MWPVLLSLLRRLPQGALSRAFGWLADRRIPRPLRPVVLGGFVRATGIDMGEAGKPLAEYPSLNALFVRRLAPGVRGWPGDPSVLASPVDGVVGQLGDIRDGLLLQAKGLEYTVAELLAGDEEEAATYRNGSFITLYLSPRHYHRIHTPLPGSVTRARHVPGALLPVNGPAVRSQDRLFARNERVTAFLETGAGPVAVVAVGAYNVGRISTAFDRDWAGPEAGWVSNRRRAPEPERRYAPPVPLAPGAELMAFHLGSTVVLLTGETLRLEASLAPGEPVRVGQPLAVRRARLEA